MDVLAVLPTVALTGVLREPLTDARMRALNAARPRSPILPQEACAFSPTALKHRTRGVSLSSPLRTFSFGHRKLTQRKRASSAFKKDKNGSAALIVAASTGGDAGIPDGVGNGRISGSLSSSLPDDPGALKAALLAAESRALEAEKAARDAYEALSISEAKAEEYAAAIVQTTEEAMAQLDASKRHFKSEVKKMLDEKSHELALAKQDAVKLAINVERITESALLEATHNISMGARLKASTAETAAAEAAYRVEESIYHATADAAALLMKEASSAMSEAMTAAATAQEQAVRAQEARARQLEVFDQLAEAKSAAVSLQGKIALLQQQLDVSENSVESLRAELGAAHVRIDAAVARVARAEAKVKEVQAAAAKAAREQDECMKQALEAITASVASREDSSHSATSADAEALRAAQLAAQEAGSVKELANNRRSEALERSLSAAEAIAKAWKNRCLLLEGFLLRVKEEGSGALPSVGAKDLIAGGRMDTLLGNDARKWDLLANGPRRATPAWMKWRIEAGQQGLPPRNPLPITSEIVAEIPLQLPTKEEVWLISSAKVREDDPFTKQAVEKEALDEQRKALERALKDRTGKSDLKDTEGKQESGTGTGKEIVFQGFNWESWRRKWYMELAPKAADLSKCGITTIWLPPPTTSVSPQGYMPGDLYNLNSAYGTVDELKACIEEMHRNGIRVLGDAVLNHRCAQKQSANGVWNVFGGKLAWGPEAIVKDDPNFQGRGNPSSGDIFHAAPNIDHSQNFVRKDITEWMKWLRAEIGFDGWRLDFVRGFWGGYVKEYIEATNPNFAIGEYWDSLAYEGGQVSYNQDAHRQRIVNWINATGGTSSAFDVTTKGILHSALHGEFWRLIDPQGKPPGVMGWWPSRAVTFLENHDTGSTQGHWPFPRDKLMQGYAYILTHPGTPVVFYDHFYDFGLHDQIAELIAARKRTGVHCRSQVKIIHANFDGYVAQVGDNLLMKLGKIDWNPAKENTLAGTWERHVDKGADFQIWERE